MKPLLRFVITLHVAMVDKEYLPDEDPFIYKVAYTSQIEYRSTTATRVEVRPGMFSQPNNFGVPSVSQPHSMQPVRLISGDEVLATHAARLVNSFQGYSRDFGSAHAALMVLIDIVVQQTKTDLPRLTVHDLLGQPR